MASLTSTSHALLGLLAIRSWSTYELAKQVERSLGWFWPRAERKVYDEAKRLVAGGYARSTDESTGARPRTVYRITPKGRRALTKWLRESSAPAKLESEALVRVFFADSATLDDLQRTIGEVADAARAQLAQLRTLVESIDDQQYPFSDRLHLNALSLRFQLDHQRMTLSWAEWAGEQVAQWNDVDDPGAWVGSDVLRIGS